MSFVRARHCLRLALFGAGALMLLAGCPKKDEESTESEKPAAEEKAEKPAAPAKTLIKVNRRADGKASYIWLKTVEVSSKETVISMQIKNDGKTTLQGLRVSPPGHADAFYIMTPDKRRVDLKSTDGMNVNPDTTDLAPGESIDFTLTFGPLDPSLESFDLLEGANQDPNSTYWNFKGVKLR